MPIEERAAPAHEGVRHSRMMPLPGPLACATTVRFLTTCLAGGDSELRRRGPTVPCASNCRALSNHLPYMHFLQLPLQEVTLSYVEEAQPYVRRQRALRQGGWAFRCGCRRCTDESTSGLARLIKRMSSFGTGGGGGRG